MEDLFTELDKEFFPDYKKINSSEFIENRYIQSFLKQVNWKKLSYEEN